MNLNDIASPKKGVSIADGIGKARTFFGIALFVAVFVLLILLVQRALPSFSDTASHVTPTFAFVRESLLLAVVMAATSAVGYFEGRNPLAFGLEGPKRVSYFAQGCAWGFALLSLLVFCLIASQRLVLDQRVLGGFSALGYGIVWLVCCLIVAIAEETLFRGYLQAALARVMGFWPAAAVLSLCFGLVHIRNHGEVLIGIIVVMLSGAVFCFCLKRTGSLWWGIGFHTAWDWAQSFLYGTPDSGIVIVGRLVESHPLGNPLLSGGATGPEGSIFLIPTMALALVGIYFTLNRRGVVSRTFRSKIGIR